MDRRFGIGAAGIGVGLIAAAAGALGAPSAWWFVAGLLGVALLLHAVFVGEAVPAFDQRPDTADTGAPPELVGGRRSVDLTPRQLMRPFRDHSDGEAMAAVRQYIGGWLKVQGKVERVHAAPEPVVVLLTGGEGSPTVSAFLAPGAVPTWRLRQIRPGERVALVGRIDEIKGWTVVLRGCELAT